jgi:hypothetical protein
MDTLKTYTAAGAMLADMLGKMRLKRNSTCFE